MVLNMIIIKLSAYLTFINVVYNYLKRTVSALDLQGDILIAGNL